MVVLILDLFLCTHTHTRVIMHLHVMIITILTSPFHILLLISNNQESLAIYPPTTSRCGPVLLLISTLE